MILFSYDPSLANKFTSIRGGVIWARDLANGPTTPALAEAFRAEQMAVIEKIANTPLSAIQSLSAWRRTFSAFGVKPTQYRSAAEALLRRLTKTGDIPNLNLLVDIGNLVSIRYGLPVAFFDRRGFTGTLTVTFAAGDEQFTDLGSDNVTHPETGEVIFVDEQRLVSARRWCWRQSDQSACRDDTTEALITVEGLHDSAEDDVQGALEDLDALLREYVPGVQLESALLTPEQPAFEVENA
jgi:DNA/RNA-binding domain of Phe-tRNA-synthetase-like protein